MKILLPVFFLFLTMAGFSQTKVRIRVSGTVADSSGAPMSQVTVTEKGTSNGSTTGADGKFSLFVAGERSVLVFTSVGFTPVEMRVGSKRDFSAVMDRANKEMNEIVVVGYGTRKKESLTGAIATVTSKDICRVHAG